MKKEVGRRQEQQAEAVTLGNLPNGLNPAAASYLLLRYSKMKITELI